MVKQVPALDGTQHAGHLVPDCDDILFVRGMFFSETPFSFNFFFQKSQHANIFFGGEGETRVLRGADWPETFLDLIFGMGISSEAGVIEGERWYKKPHRVRFGSFCPPGVFKLDITGRDLQVDKPNYMIFLSFVQQEHSTFFN